MRRTLAIGALALGLALAGCGSPATTSGSSAPPAAGYGSGGGYGSGSTGSSTSGLKLAQTSLGKVVVTSDGMTAYVFDKDTKGTQTSACTGACAAQWPPILVTGGKPMGDGITGALGMIPAAGGKEQVTLDGRPLYTYSGDSAAGDVKGQGIMGIWWVVDAGGAKIGG